MSLDDARRLREGPVSRVLTVKCDRMHVGDRILLIGDAAHAVSPSIGQGCNAALQDVQVLTQLTTPRAKATGIPRREFQHF